MIRLQKAIADAGFTSRRKAEDLIRQGRVFVNDKRADLGDKVSIGDNVYIDGKKINTDAENEIKILIIVHHGHYISMITICNHNKKFCQLN